MTGSTARSVHRSTGGLLAVAGYGVAMLLTGALVLTVPGGSASAAAGRSVQAAPVVAPSATVDGVDRTVDPGPPGPDDATTDQAEDAGVGQARGVRDPFVPSTLVLWDGRSAPVVRSDVRSDGSLVVPDDPGTVGWWTGGAQAGEAFGRIVVAGHVDSATRGLGVFVELARVRTGQVVTLRSAGRAQRYKVVRHFQVKQAALGEEASIFAQDGAHRLVLITCGGAFDRTLHRYEDNLVVEAVPVV
jgi:hypothetical protein